MEFKELGCLPVIVVEGITHECILGDDALSTGKAILNYDHSACGGRGGHSSCTLIEDHLY